MTTEFNELLPISHDEKPQIWIIGTREQVTHLMNEFTVKRLVTERIHFSPIIPRTVCSWEVYDGAGAVGEVPDLAPLPIARP